MTLQILTSAFLSHATSPVERTQQIPPQEDSTHQLLISSQQLTFQKIFGKFSSISINDGSPTELALNPESTLLNPTPNTASTMLHIRYREIMTQPETDLSSTTLTAKVCVSKPSAYSPNLFPHPSPLQPHCLAQDRLCLWKPSPAVLSHHSTTQEDNIDKIFDMMSNAWAASTRESYSAGILVYHVYCDSKSIPEEL